MTSVGPNRAVLKSNVNLSGNGIDKDLMTNVQQKQPYAGCDATGAGVGE